MAQQLSAASGYCIQHSRFTKQDGWRLRDLSLSLNGNIAVTGFNMNTHRTYIDVYSNVRYYDSRNKPKIIYSKEFDKYQSKYGIAFGRIISFYLGSDSTILSGLGDKLEVIDLIQDRVIKSRKIKLVKRGDLSGTITCLSVRETEIFIGFASNEITVYDVTDLNEIKSIILQGIQDGYFPFDMTIITDRIFVCVGENKEGSINKSLIFEEKNGRILSELTKPTDSVTWYANSVGVNMNTLGIAAVLWHDFRLYKEGEHNQIVFYSLLSENNCSFLIVEVEFGVSRIRISDKGDRIVTRNKFTGEVKVYDMAEVFTYSHFKEKLASTLRTDECRKLANFFKISEDQKDAILGSDKPSENLLVAFEEKGFLHPYNAERLKDAFVSLGISSLCLYLTEIYQKTRAQSTSYGRFLATLSSHLTSSIPANLCDYFKISGEKKTKIINSQNPGLSLLLALDEMGVIRISEVGALEEPFDKMLMVQAVAKIHEYQSILEEAESLLQKQEELTEEGKRALFIQGLKKKIFSWYETMTPVPWKKSCRWKSTELFIGCSLMQTDKKTLEVSSPEADSKIHYTGIFSDEKLKSDIRLIIEGDPGSGKTMLMSQLAYDWCQEKFKEIDMLVLLPLKFVEQKPIVQTIKDFYFPDDERLSVSDIESFLSNHTISRCLLLDGLEEYNSGVKDNRQSEVTKIMQKSKYPTCKVVISSRSDYAQNLPECPTLKLAKFSDHERNTYIQKVFPENPKTQIQVRNVIKDNPFILDLCSIPLLFVLVVHNIESFLKFRMGALDRVTPLVKNMVDTLCPAGSLVGFEGSKETSLGELAFNGLCRGYQQLFWQKDFIESKITNSRDWIDAGVLVVEESSRGVPMVALDEEQFVTSSGHGAVARISSSGATVMSGSSSPSSSDFDEDSEGATKSGDSSSQSEPTQTSGSTAKHVPLQVRFLHKIIQEWFAADHLAYTISKYRGESYLQKYLNEQLPFIDPSDLHFVLRFTVALYTPCCHLVIKYLLKTYRSKEGSIPQHIIDCIFLCFAEYDGENRPSLLEAVTEVFKEDVVIRPENSRLLQQAKVRMIELASKYGIPIKKISLLDIVVSASDNALEFMSGIMMDVSDTLEVIEIIDHDGFLMEEDYTNLLKFIENCSLVREACLHFSSEPPPVNEETAKYIREDEKTITWRVGSQHPKTLNTTSGEWTDENEEAVAPEIDEEADNRMDEDVILETKDTVSSSGGVIEIPNTGVRLFIPQGAFEDGLEECSISMKIIPPDVTDKATHKIDFTSNSSVIVELLPDGLTFQKPVELTIPHCLQLVKGAEYKASIFMSHHKEGMKPSWEEKGDHLHHLTNSSCKILLDSFCWVKYHIDGRIVDAKRIQVYAAGKLLSFSDEFYQTEVGYYPDVPGAGQILLSKERLVVASKKTFLFHKENEEPLKILLKKIVPKEWKHLQEEENPKEIPFERIAVDEEWSRRFVFWKTSEEPLIPMFIFRVLQGSRGIRLLDRPEVLQKPMDNESNISTSTSSESQEILKEPIPEGKKELLIWCIKQKIERLHENDSLVPLKESWRWRSMDLFTGGDLVLTKSTSEEKIAVCNPKCKLKHREIFTHEGLKSVTRISLEGDSGSGKTMLACQLAHDWSHGKLSGIDILILLPLRLVGNKTLAEALIELYIPEDKSLFPHDIEDILTNEINQCCFILDGLEEYSATEDPSEVMKVMTKMKYPKSKVLLTSRSGCAQALSSCPILKLEPIGETERSDYLRKVFPGNSQKQQEVKELIEGNPLILDLCHIPVFLAIVAHNLDAMQSTDWDNLNGVASFIRTTVHTLCSSFGTGDINRMLGAKPIGEFAYKGLCRRVQQLSWQRDIIERTVPNSQGWIDAGILVVDNSYTSVMHREDQQQNLPIEAGLITIPTVSANISSTRGKDILEHPSEPSEYSEKTTSETGAVPKTKPKSSVSRKKIKYKGLRSKKKRHQNVSDKQSLTSPSPTESRASVVKSDTEHSSVNTRETGLLRKHAPSHLKFCHKIIQEWFAAKHLSSTLSNCETPDMKLNLLNENLKLMNPADLHYLLRFVCAFHPSCCHFVLTYLLKACKTVEKTVANHIMNCIFLCLAEYNSNVEPNILLAMSKICKRDIVIHHEDSRLLQKAKVSVMTLASDYGIVMQKLLIIGQVFSASEHGLVFSSGVTLKTLDTLQSLEIIALDQTVKDEEYKNIMKFIGKCVFLKDAKLHFHSQPPALDRSILKELKTEDKTVTWAITSGQRLTLDTSSGKWLNFDDDKQSSASNVGSISTGVNHPEPVLETVATITKSGGTFEIPHSGVRLDVPPDALQRGINQCTIQMRITLPSLSLVSLNDLTNNSSVTIELCPADLKLQFPVQLRIPHCLQLKKDAKYHARIFFSHHEEGDKPHWEEQMNPKYVLMETYCTILLNNFCSVKFTVDEKLVEAKRLQIYAAGGKVSLCDQTYEVEVGCYPDLPGGEDVINKHMVVATRKPFLFYKEGGEPLQLLLQNVLPSEWKLARPEENPVRMRPFESIAMSQEESCHFVFQKKTENPIVPLFLFRVLQGERGVRLIWHPEVKEENV